MEHKPFSKDFYSGRENVISLRSSVPDFNDGLVGSIYPSASLSKDNTSQIPKQPQQQPEQPMQNVTQTPMLQVPGAGTSTAQPQPTQSAITTPMQRPQVAQTVVPQQGSSTSTPIPWATERDPSPPIPPEQKEHTPEDVSDHHEAAMDTSMPGEKEEPDLGGDPFETPETKASEEEFSEEPGTYPGPKPKRAPPGEHKYDKQRSDEPSIAAKPEDFPEEPIQPPSVQRGEGSVMGPSHRGAIETAPPGREETFGSTAWDVDGPIEHGQYGDKYAGIKDLGRLHDAFASREESQPLEKPEGDVSKKDWKEYTSGEHKRQLQHWSDIKKGYSKALKRIAVKRNYLKAMMNDSENPNQEIARQQHTLLGEVNRALGEELEHHDYAKPTRPEWEEPKAQPGQEQPQALAHPIHRVQQAHPGAYGAVSQHDTWQYPHQIKNSSDPNEFKAHQKSDHNTRKAIHANASAHVDEAIKQKTALLKHHSSLMGAENQAKAQQYAEELQILSSMKDGLKKQKPQAATFVPAGQQIPEGAVQIGGRPHTEQKSNEQIRKELRAIKMNKVLHGIKTGAGKMLGTAPFLIPPAAAQARRSGQGVSGVGKYL